MSAAQQRCKHGMLPGMCAGCAPPRVANVPVKRSATMHSAGAVSTEMAYGFVVVRTAGGKDQVTRHGLDAIDERTHTVHIDGHPFLWAIEAILAKAPKLQVIQMIPTMTRYLREESHLALCRARGVEVKAGHFRPDLAWAEDREVSKHYEPQRRFLLHLAGPQRALFEELLTFGFEEAAMAKRYYRLDGQEDRVTQSVLAREFGYRENANSPVSAKLLAVLYYLDDTTAVGDVGKIMGGGEQDGGALTRERARQLEERALGALNILED